MVHHRCDIPIGSLTLPAWCTNKTNELNSSLLIEWGEGRRLVCLCFVFWLFVGLKWVNGRMCILGRSFIFLVTCIVHTNAILHSAKIFFSRIESMLIFTCTTCFMSRNTFMSKNRRKASHHCQINHGKSLFAHCWAYDIPLNIYVHVHPYLLCSSSFHSHRNLFFDFSVFSTIATEWWHAKSSTRSATKGGWFSSTNRLLNTMDSRHTSRSNNSAVH